MLIIELLFGWWLYKELSRSSSSYSSSSERRFVEYSPLYTSVRERVDDGLRNFSYVEGEELKALSTLKWLVFDIASSLRIVVARNDYRDWQYSHALSRANSQAGWVILRLNSMVRSLERTGVSHPHFTKSDFNLLMQQAQQLRDVVVEHYKIEDAPDVVALIDLAESLAQRTWEQRKHRV